MSVLLWALKKGESTSDLKYWERPQTNLDK